MPALIRTLQLVLAAVLLVSVSDPVASGTALASPHPYPMPFREADYGGHLPSVSHATLHRLVKRSRPARSTLVNSSHEEKYRSDTHTTVNSTTVPRDDSHASTIRHLPAEHVPKRRGSDSMDTTMNKMSDNDDAMSSHATNYRELPPYEALLFSHLSFFRESGITSHWYTKFYVSNGPCNRALRIQHKFSSSHCLTQTVCSR